MRHGSLFSGIGGFDLAAEWMGWENVFHCEWNEFGKKVLNYYWPNAISYHDITKTDFTIHKGTIDILTGGFPCQPYSAAGKRLGKEDDRHLWPEMLRAIREIQPTFVVGENVRGLTNWNGGMVFDEVQADLEAESYEVTPFLLPACAVNAPHRRDRIWFVANRNGSGFQKERAKQQTTGTEQYGKLHRTSTDSDINTTGPSGTSGATEGNRSENDIQSQERRGTPELNTGSHELLRDVTDTDGIGGIQTEGWGNGEPNVLNENGTARTSLYSNSTIEQGQHFGQTRERKFNGSDSRNGISNWQNFPTQSPIRGRNDGFPEGMVLESISESKWRNESIKAYGNAIVPQVAFEIFKAIQRTL
jgi:DNA (cytosine-5)-methyltransferase 1